MPFQSGVACDSNNRKNPNGIQSLRPGLARSAGLPWVIRQEFPPTPTWVASQCHKFEIREDAPDELQRSKNLETKLCINLMKARKPTTTKGCHHVRLG